MTHFGIICPGATGHLNTMFPLGRELQRRGHRVTVFGTPKIESKVLAVNLGFQVIGESDFSPEKDAEFLAQLGKLTGLAALGHSFRGLKRRAEVSLRDTPTAARKIGIEALLVDQAAFEGSTIAQWLNLPFVTVCSALVLNQHNSIPPGCTTWGYHPAWWSYLRNQVAYSAIHNITQPIREVIYNYRHQWHLPPYTSDKDLDSPFAIISQQPAEFEFPRSDLPPHFHFTGPFHGYIGRQSVEFPFHKLNGKPLIYASLGTIQNRLQYIFHHIAEACTSLDAQLVISLGGSLTPEALPKLPGEPIVVQYAPQLQLLNKASLTITHAGLNTTLESLSRGVPMVAIPINNDQPGVAARIAWTGTGEFIRLSLLRVPRLRAAIERVLNQDSYRKNAGRLQVAINTAGRVSRAVNIIEQVVATGKPVLR